MEVSAVVLHEVGAVPGVTETALILPEGMTEGEWESLGEKLGRAYRASGWWIGDWINHGIDAGFIARDLDGRYAALDAYDRAEELSGLKRGTLRVYAYVARSYPALSRDNAVSFKAHRLALGNGHTSAPVAHIIRGLCIIARRYGDSLDEAALVKKLGKYPGGPGPLIGYATIQAKVKGGAIGRNLAVAVVDLYNKGRRSGQLAPL